MTHDLGKLEHIYAKRHLKLTTQAFITLSSLNALQFPFSTVFDHIHCLVSTETWINSGNSFRFRLSLSSDDVIVEGGDMSAHFEELGLVLCNAEVPEHHTNQR